MAQSDGDGIGGIVGLGHGGKMQKPLGHVLHLMLGGIAVTYHSLLDLHGLVFKDGDARLPNGKQYHTTALRHIDTGGNVLSEKQFFDGNCFGFGLLQKLGHIVIDDFQPPGEFRIGGAW